MRWDGPPGQRDPEDELWASSSGVAGWSRVEMQTSAQVHAAGSDPGGSGGSLSGPQGILMHPKLDTPCCVL